MHIFGNLELFILVGLIENISIALHCKTMIVDAHANNSYECVVD